MKTVYLNDGHVVVGERGAVEQVALHVAQVEPGRERDAVGDVAAADLVVFLTGPEEQKRRAIQGAYNPTIESLYKDPEVLAALERGEL